MRTCVFEAYEPLKNAREPASTLVIAHGGVIRVLLGSCVGLSTNNEFALSVDDVGLSCVDLYEDSFGVRFVNWGQLG